MILRHWAFCSQSSWITECVEINSRDFNVCIVQIRNFTLYYILNFSIHNFYCIVLKILDRYLLYLILLLKNKWKTKQNKKKPEYFFLSLTNTEVWNGSPVMHSFTILLSDPCKQFNPFCISCNCTLSTLKSAEFFISSVISKTEAKVQQQRKSQGKWSSVTRMHNFPFVTTSKMHSRYGGSTEHEWSCNILHYALKFQ